MTEEISKSSLQRATVYCHTIDKSYYFIALEINQRHRNGELFMLGKLLSFGKEQRQSVLFPHFSVVLMSGLQSCADWQFFYLEHWVISISISIISGSDLLKAGKQVRANCLAVPALHCGWDWAKHVSGWSCTCVQLIPE